MTRRFQLWYASGIKKSNKTFIMTCNCVIRFDSTIRYFVSDQYSKPVTINYLTKNDSTK